MKTIRSVLILTLFLTLAFSGRAQAQEFGPNAPETIPVFTLDGVTTTINKWTGQVIRMDLQVDATGDDTNHRLCIGINYASGSPYGAAADWQLPTTTLYDENTANLIPATASTANGCNAVNWDIEQEYDLGAAGVAANGGAYFTILLLVPPKQDDNDTPDQTMSVQVRHYDSGGTPLITTRGRNFIVKQHLTVLNVAQTPAGCGSGNDPCYADVTFGTSPAGTTQSFSGLQGALDAADDGDQVRILGTYNVGSQQVTLDPNGQPDFDLSLTYAGGACGSSAIGSTSLGGTNPLLTLDDPPGVGNFGTVTIQGLTFNGTQGTGKRDSLIAVNSSVTGTVNILENDLQNSDVQAILINAGAGAVVNVKRNYIGGNAGLGLQIGAASAATVSVEDNSFVANNGGSTNQQAADNYTAGVAVQTAYRNWWGSNDSSAAVYGAGAVNNEWSSNGATTPDWNARLGASIVRNTGCGVQVWEETVPAGNYTNGGLFWNGARLYNSSGGAATYTIVNHGYDNVPFGAGSGGYVYACSRYYNVYQDGAATGLTLDMDYNRNATCATNIVNAYLGGSISHWFYVSTTNWDLINGGTASVVSGTGCASGTSCIDTGNNFTRAILSGASTPPVVGTTSGGSSSFVTGSPNSPTVIDLQSLTASAVRNTWLPLILLILAVLVVVSGIWLVRRSRMA